MTAGFGYGYLGGHIALVRWPDLQAMPAVRFLSVCRIYIFSPSVMPSFVLVLLMPPYSPIYNTPGQSKYCMKIRDP